MAAPQAVAFLVQAGVSMTEVWYIGQLGRTSLAAMAFVFPGLMLMQMFWSNSCSMPSCRRPMQVKDTRVTTTRR